MRKPLAAIAFLTVVGPPVPLPVRAAEPLVPAAEIKATISQSRAEEIARAKVARGVAASASLEREGANLVWVVQVKSPDSVILTQVRVDASSAKVLSTRAVAVEAPTAAETPRKSP